MALTIGDNFSYLGGKPLDGRLKYNTLADMVAMAESTLYDGCLAYCVESDKNYQWKSSNDSDDTLGKWREFGSGGSSSGTMLTGTLSASSWSNKSQTVTVTGVKADDSGSIGLLNTATTAQIAAAKNAGLVVTTIADDSITFTCEETPTIDIPFGVNIN